MQIREIATAVTQNILDLESQTWRSKLLKMPFLVNLGSLTILISVCWKFLLNNGKFQKKHCYFFCSTDTEGQHIPSKSLGNFLSNVISCCFIKSIPGFDPNSTVLLLQKTYLQFEIDMAIDNL